MRHTQSCTMAEFVWLHIHLDNLQQRLFIQNIRSHMSHIHTQTLTHARTHAPTHAPTHTHTHTHSLARTHTHTHTHTHTRCPNK